MRRLSFMLATYSLGVTSVCWADTLAYVRASSQAELASDAAKYHPLNLLDDDVATMWCEGDAGPGEDQEVVFFFKEPQKIDRLVITPATGSGRVVLKVEVSDGRNSIGVELVDAIVERQFSPPMKGERFTVTIREIGEPSPQGGLDANTACLADVLLFWKKNPFGGRVPLSALKYNKFQDRILGTWNGGPLGAPEKKLTFGLDGSWQWEYEPLMSGKGQKMAGEYRFRGNRLLMRKGETGRWSDMRFAYKDIHVDPSEAGAPEGDYQVLSFNEALGPVFEGEYNNARF